MAAEGDLAVATNVAYGLMGLLQNTSTLTATLASRGIDDLVVRGTHVQFVHPQAG